MQANKGFTLIELMIGIVLNVMLSMGAVHVFVLVKQAWLTQQGIHKIQENARIIQIYFDKALQDAGQLHCNRIHEGLRTWIAPTVNENAFGIDNIIRLVSFSSLKETKLLTPSFFERLKPDTSIIWLISFEAIENLTDTQNKILSFSDCATLHIFKHVKSNTEIQPFSIKTWLFQNGVPWIPNGELGVLNSRLYYIGRTNREINHRPVYALYMTDLNGYTQELVEGVQAMHISIEGKNKLKMSLLLDSVQTKVMQKEWLITWDLNL
jgi:prepilin-type N-terminal cleavage/methylation domain-containing protein